MIVDSDSTDILGILDRYDIYEDSLFLNIADVNEEQNKWYLKWLGDENVPRTCIFTNNGDIVDVVPDIVDFKDIMYTLNYPIDNNTVSEQISTLGKVLINQMFIETGADVREDVENTMNTLQYPFVYFQNLLCSIVAQDSVGMESAAYSLLDFESLSRYSNLYANEFKIAHSIVSDTELLNGPKIDLIRNGNKTTAIREVELINSGNETLIISKISENCNCIRNLSENDLYKVPPGKTIGLKFEVSEYDSNNHMNEVYVFSNAINSPIFKIPIIL